MCPSGCRRVSKASSGRQFREWRRPRTSRLLLVLVPLVLLLAGTIALNPDLTTLDPSHGLWSATLPWGNQTFTLPGVEQPVQIVRDGSGTVHIYAQDDPDLMYGQGFEQASDRLFQMEIESLAAQGNVSTWVGGAGVASDIAFRMLGLSTAALEVQEQMATASPTLAVDVNAFCAGVNAYIAWAEANDRLGVYFTGLGVQPYTWTPFDTFAFMELMIYGQTTGIVEPIYAALAASAVGDNATNEMFPIYPQYYANFTVMPGDGSINGTSLSGEGVSPAYVFAQDWLAPWATGISTSEQSALAPLYRQALNNLNDPYVPIPKVSEGGGSNSWVVAANHSADGLPMLANDPHLPVTLPSLWIPTQLTDPNYEVQGWALAGLPGILIGHDRYVSWALTNSAGSTALDYVETLNGNTYLQNGTWHPLRQWNETWTVAANATSGAHTYTLPMAATDHGQLIARVGSHGLSLDWAADGPTWEAMAELEFDRATSVQQFIHILHRWWTVPNLNALISENDGNGTTHIGWSIPAHYPLVKVRMPNGQNVTVIASRAPLNGDGGYEEVGTIPVSQMPQAEDPAQGYLYAPNQPTVGQNFPYPMIGSFWDSGGRAHAVGTFLEQHAVMSIPLMQQLQSNVTDQWALLYRSQLIQTLETVSGGNTAAAALATQALPYVQAWNGSFNIDEVAPTIYTYWYNEIVQNSYEPAMSAFDISSPPDPFPDAIHYISQHDPNSSWFPGGWSALSNQSMVSALELLQGKLAAQGIATVSGWTWGIVHTWVLPSLTGETMFQDGPYQHWGDGYTVSVAPSTTALTVPLTEVSVASSLRMISEPNPDLPDGGTNLGIIPGGLTENPVSPYYDIQLPLWLAHEYVDTALVPTASGPFPQQEVSLWTLQP